MAAPMLPANAPVLAALALPVEYAITDAQALGVAEQLARVEARMQDGLRLVQVREVMRFQTIAEMVEEQDILLRLKALGVAYAQGFGILQPHPIEKIARSRPG